MGASMCPCRLVILTRHANLIAYPQTICNCAIYNHMNELYVKRLVLCIYSIFIEISRLSNVYRLSISTYMHFADYGCVVQMYT